MDAQDFRSLQEAYLEVVENHQLNEDSRRMSNKQRTASVRQNIKAFGSNFTPPNNYDPDANRGQGEVLTRKQIEKKRRKELRQEEVSVYDIILTHLLDEGYAETPEAAEAIMVNMSEEWREDIVEMSYKKLPVGKMINQSARHNNPKLVAKMAKVADTHNPAQAKRKEDDNRREGGRKRDAGRPRSNELQDNW